jgi:hypothetical protein
LLGFGAFHPNAPWALLHELPFFASQHVPSRFHFPMLLLLGAAFVALAARHVDELVRQKPWLDLVLLVPVAVLAWDMSRFSRTPFEQAFWMQAPDTLRRASHFEHRLDPPVQYVRRDWAAPILLAMFANQGVIRCYGFDPDFEPGAIPKESEDYRGLAWVAEGSGNARVVEWTTNRAVIEVSGASPEAVVAYDMNYDSSWRADGEPALDYDGVVAGRLGANTNRMHAPLLAAAVLRDARSLLLAAELRPAPSRLVEPFSAVPAIIGAGAPARRPVLMRNRLQALA